MHWFILALALFAPLCARAELGSLFGIGPKSMGMGGVALLEGEENPFQVYSAPAALGFLRKVEIDYGVQYFQPNLRSFGTLNLNSAGTQGALNDSGVLPGGGSLLGFALPLGSVRPLVLGGAIYLPFSTLIRVSGTPVDYPFYPLYTDISRNFFFVVGAGYEVMPGLAVGINVRSTTKSTVSYVLRSDSSINYSASATEARSQSRLSYSVVYDHGRVNPERAWSAGLMYRGQAGMESKIMADVSVFVPVQGAIVSDPSFTPAEWSAMGSWKLSPGFMISAEVARVLWSAYTSPYGSGNINSYVINGSSAAASFHDIWVPRLGFEQSKPVETRALKRLFLREGYLYHPSPVPDQTGDSNYVDSNRHLFSLGGGASFVNPWKEGSFVDLDLFTQYNLLTKRTITKYASTNVGAPGYIGGGNIWLFGGGVSLRF